MSGMIDEIQVRNLALIEEAAIRPSAGMTVITGETGAGKTALLASCKLLMGQRADRDMVRQGQQEAEVQGRFFLPLAASEAPEGEDDPVVSDPHANAEAELVVDRRVTSDGRSHVKMNGRMASVSELSDAVSPYVSLCSQHDQQMLTKQSAQRRYLDVWAGVDKDGLLGEYREAFLDAKKARAELDDVKAMAQAGDSRVEEALFKLRQIDAVSPSQEDYDELMRALRKSENAEMLARTSSESRDVLSGEEGVLDALNAAIVLLDEGARADDSLKAMANTLREATYIVEDVAHDVSRYADAIDLDVSSLDQMQERASSYQSLLRAYGPTMDDVLSVECEARAIVEAHEDADAVLAAAEERVALAEDTLALAAKALSESRSAAAPGLSDAVNEVLAKLEMSGAELVVSVSKLPREDWSESGADSVIIEFRPSSGMQARPLSRIASGGELSRVMLALHAVMGNRDEVPTLVFDEIDAGVGGTAALALADVLSSLAETHQVIAVTHLPQVAARASVHYVASKSAHEGVASTSIVEVSGDERTQEIARMLSGSITESSLKHAQELQGI